MSTQPARSRGSRTARVAAYVVTALVLAVVIALVVDLVLRRPAEQDGAVPEPAQIEPPAGLKLPRFGAPDPVAAAARSRRLRVEAARRSLAPFLDDADLGRHVLAAVEPLSARGPGYVRGAPTDVATPASTTKLFTCAAALLALGPEHTFTTRVVETRGSTPSASRSLVLVGGGDPFLASEPPEPDPDLYPARADVVTLARLTAATLRQEKVRRVSLDFDDSLFAGPAISPRWPASYVPDGVVAPIDALWVDEGRDPVGYGYLDDPATTAATTYAAALAREGIEVTGTPSRVVLGRRGHEVAAVTSAPLAGIVEHLLEVSDNQAAEVLLRQVGLATHDDGSFLGGQTGVRETLGGVGIDLAAPLALYDGSGLSRENRMSPSTLVDLLRLAASPEQPDLRPVVTGLSVAGFLGSLSDRFDTGDARAPGRLRAKTGTLSNVFALAGMTTDADGSPVVFALMADRIELDRTLEALETMDEAAASLAGCRCTR